jgi:hypothetical protein
MINIKKYEEFINEEISWKKTLGSVALGASLSMNPVIASVNYNKEKIEQPSDTTRISGLDEIAKIKCSVYPNPCRDLLNFRLESSESVVSLYIYSINGDLMKQIKPDDFEFNSKSIDVSSLSSGMYLFVIETSKSKESVKFVKL